MKNYFYLILMAFLFFSCEKESFENASNLQKVKNEKGQNANQYWDAIYEVRNGVEYDVTDKQHNTKASSTHEFYEIAAMNPVYVYPGAVLSESSINGGVYKIIGAPNEWKPKVDVSFSLLIDPVNVSPSKAAWRTALNRSINSQNFDGQQSQYFSYKMKQISRYSETKLAFGANINVGAIFNLSINGTNDKIHATSALIVDFNQIYFSAYMDFPYDGNIFLNETILNKHKSEKPAYINTVNYGRKGIILVESTYSYEATSLAIRAAFTAKIVNGSLNIDVDTKKILDEASITLCIWGGDGAEAVKTIEGFEAFKDFVIKGGVYTRQVYGVPISFGASYAEDNSMFITKFNIES